MIHSLLLRKKIEPFWVLLCKWSHFQPHTSRIFSLMSYFLYFLCVFNMTNLDRYKNKKYNRNRRLFVFKRFMSRDRGGFLINRLAPRRRRINHRSVFLLGNNSYHLIFGVLVRSFKKTREIADHSVIQMCLSKYWGN